MYSNIVTKSLYFLFYLLISISILKAENNMELIAEFTGEHYHSTFGFQVASLDFNGDDIDDLIVGSDRWDPDYSGEGQPNGHQGKIYFYLGPINADKTVDFTISKNDSLWGYGHHLESLGDMNGDGFDDLGFYSTYIDTVEWGSHFYANILFGNSVMDSIPDFSFEFLDSDFGGNHYPYLKKLGDINGDGFDDAGFVIEKRTTPTDRLDWIYIVYGNSFELNYFCSFNYNVSSTQINGIGDVNNDGFDDFIIGHSENPTTAKLLYFGETVNDSIPDIILSDYVATNYDNPFGGVALGDWDGDGIADFNVGNNVNGTDIWFGSENYLQPYMYLQFGEWLMYRNHDFGDLNGDGKSDFVGGFSGPTGWDGVARIYLGAQNGTRDYSILGECGVNLGWGVAIGDYNNDGFDDIAVSGDGEGGWYTNNTNRGKVYIYAGNSELEELDPDIGIQNDVVPKPEIDFNAYPNPFNPSTTISFSLNTEITEGSEIEIYNIKGQKVITLPASFDSAQDDNNNITWNGTDQSGQLVTSGIYFYKLNVENSPVGKMVLLK